MNFGVLNVYSAETESLNSPSGLNKKVQILLTLTKFVTKDINKLALAIDQVIPSLNKRVQANLQ